MSRSAASARVGSPLSQLRELARSTEPVAQHEAHGRRVRAYKAKLLAGAVEIDQNFALGTTDLDEGYALMCQAQPTSRVVTVDYDA